MPTSRPDQVIDTSLTLLQRINEVRKTNAYIKKDKKVDGQYMVVSHDQVTAELRDDLIKWGVLILPSVVAGTAKFTETGLITSKGAKIIRFEAEYDIKFVNVDDKADIEVLRLPAHALDTGDKAPGKALSYAVKGAMLKMFNIETGERDEDREESDATAGMTAKEHADWRSKIDEVTNAEGAAKVWADIAKAIKVSNDERALTSLRAHFTATMKKKGIQQTTKGARDATKH